MVKYTRAADRESDAVLRHQPEPSDTAVIGILETHGMFDGSCYPSREHHRPTARDRPRNTELTPHDTETQRCDCECQDADC